MSQAPATKAFVATCGTISGHLVSNEDHREKILLNTSHLWARLQDRLSLAGVPLDQEKPIKRRVDISDGGSAPPDLPSRNRTSGGKERRPLRINTEIRSKTARRRASQVANVAGAATDSQPSIAAPVNQYKRKDSGTAVHDDSPPPCNKGTSGGLVAAHEADCVDGAATATEQRHVQKPRKPVSESLPVSPTRYTQPKRPAVQDIVDELESITESYDAHTSNILGLHALDGEGIATRRRKRSASESSAVHRRHHRHDPQHQHRRRQRSGPPPLFFFERAAERDVASAAYNAGLCYERALGGATARDLVRAIVLYRQAAVAGRHPQARYNLAVLLLRKSAAGLSGPDAALRDAEEGVGWMREAAKQGFRPAVEAMEAASSFGI
ncbi:hypothetical protein HDU87_001232 [Geranomyces variabilis]|uniref:Uncharacterized protein n=1 Tax=Geranomyces variabilis TaxID=109894 RepID=A0AAD5TBB6_9FUNG|nr:hypothetical protein HDU87_001232 [Geranomyces variabilis]